MALDFGVGAFVMPSDSNLSPVPRYGAAQYSISQYSGGNFFAAFVLDGVTLLNPITGYVIEMLIDTPSAPPSFAPSGSPNIFQIKMPMSIYSDNYHAYIPNFSAFPGPGLYTLNFYLFGTPNYVSFPTILVVTV